MVAQERAENAKSLRIALEFLPDLFKGVYLMRRTLDPELELMTALLATVSARWEEAQLHEERTNHSRDFRVLHLHEGRLLTNFLRRSFEQFSSLGLWDHMPETEAMHSELLRLSFRPCAVIYSLVCLRVRGFPVQDLHTTSP